MNIFSQLGQKLLLGTSFALTLNAWGLGKPVQNPPSSGSGGSSSSAPSTGGILEEFDWVDKSKVVPRKALTNALTYYKAKKSTLKNSNWMTIVDFTQKSNSKRMYMIDMRSGVVERFLAAHGSGSDSNHDGYATTFSNSDGSHATSLGFYHTAETYSGKHGYSLRLDGKSSTNSAARARAIVIHGADYVYPTSGVIGRSWGCPAVENSVRTRIINLIQGGSIFYHYHASHM